MAEPPGAAVTAAVWETHGKRGRSRVSSRPARSASLPRTNERRNGTLVSTPSRLTPSSACAIASSASSRVGAVTTTLAIIGS